MNRYEEAYAAGYDCEVNGANTTNCHFSHFATPELTKEWERGRDAAKVSRATRDAAEKFTADAIAAGKQVQPPEGFREYREEYMSAEELQDSDSYRGFVNTER